MKDCIFLDKSLFLNDRKDGIEDNFVKDRKRKKMVKRHSDVGKGYQDELKENEIAFEKAKAELIVRVDGLSYNTIRKLPQIYQIGHILQFLSVIFQKQSLFLSMDLSVLFQLYHSNSIATFAFRKKDSFDLGKLHDMFDFENAAKITGSKFAFFKNAAVSLELGLLRWAIHNVKREGFTPVIVPEVCKREVLDSCGFQPRDDSCIIISTINRLTHFNSTNLQCRR